MVPLLSIILVLALDLLFSMLLLSPLLCSAAAALSSILREPMEFLRAILQGPEVTVDCSVAILSTMRAIFDAFI